MAVLSLGFFLRLYALHHTYIINPDGILYIQQARAISDGKWNAAVSCGPSFVSIYPVLIAGAHVVTRDWLTAAQSVSFIFGFGLLIPVYLIFRRFFKRPISILGLLAFAMMPVLIDKSADALRDPVAWFFLCVGLYLVVSGIQLEKKAVFPVAAMVFFLVAWARIEMVTVFALTAIYLVLYRAPKKWLQLGLFLVPMILIALGLLTVGQISGFPVSKATRVDEISNRLTAPAVEYGRLQKKIDELEANSKDPHVRYFLQKSKHHIWLVALGALLTNTYEAFYFPYFLIGLVGLIGLRDRMRASPAIAYMVWVAIGSFFMLYVNILATWMIHNRFMGIVLFPSLVVIGLGIERVISIVQMRWIPNQTIAVGTVGVLIFGSGLYYAFEAREKDKYFYQEIAQEIHNRNRDGRYVRIAGAHSPVLEWVGFYSNADNPEWHCARVVKLVQPPGHGPAEALLKTSAEYLLYEENLWRQKGWDLGGAMEDPGIIPIGKWRHRDTAVIRLFRIHPMSD